MLQETHIDNINQLKLCKTEWKGEIFASFGTSQSRGVMILIKPNSVIEVVKFEVDQEGRVICLEVKIDKKKFILCNIYAPNNDDESFIEKVITILEKFQDHDGIILGGDFNLVMNTDLDRNNSKYNHNKMLQVLNTYIEKVNLCDIWRVRNPNVKRYTWHRWSKFHKPTCSRIDMILAPIGLIDSVTESSIQPGHLSDHSMVVLELKIDSYIRGPGVWKFNNQLLLDGKFCENMLKKIKETKEACCKSSLDANESWDFLKMEMGSYSKQYAKARSKKRRNRLCNLN